MFIWNSRWTCSGWIFYPGKPHPFGNEWYTDCCALYGILFVVELVEGKAHPQCRRMAEEEMRESLERSFRAYGETLETVTLIKYMGRVLTVGYDDCPAVVGNLRKARKSWMRMTMIMSR